MGEYDEKFTTPKDDIETSSGELKELINPEKQYKYYVGGHIGLNMQIPQTDITRYIEILNIESLFVIIKRGSCREIVAPISCLKNI